MDHAQGRAFHHHLARAIMHLNYLAGLLPFFEPSIEYDEGPPPANLHLDHPNTRGLHTFVPRPTSEGPPTLVSHGGIPSHMVLNPEPYLRPAATNSPSVNASMFATNPSRHANLMTDPGPTPTPASTTTITFPTAPTRTTTPVPIRSKQRAGPLVDPQPKKKQLRKGSPFLNPDSPTILMPILRHRCQLYPTPAQATLILMTPMVRWRRERTSLTHMLQRQDPEHLLLH